MGKRMGALLGVLVMIIGLAGCSRTMDDIIENEPNITGIVTEVYEKSAMIQCESLDGYTGPQECVVSLEVENSDSYTHVEIGDEIVVYYDGMIAESYPLQINKVYAITLRTPANRESE